MTRNIAVVLFDGAEELDYVGPWEVFTMLRFAEKDAVNVYTVSERGGTVTSAKGLRVVADHSFLDCPAADIVVVPGGMGTRATPHWASIKDLAERTAGKTTVVDNERFIDEGAVITAAGVSAGIDMALDIVGRIWTPETARLVQKYMEYYPEPPFAE